MEAQVVRIKRVEHNTLTPTRVAPKHLFASQRNHWVSAEYDLACPSIGVAKRRAQPMNTTKRIGTGWWLTIDALMIVMSLTIMLTVIWLSY